ncbi:MAG: septum formation initiator family protein [Methylobacteriaceae bacterium]|nr:septum formation initiator family protein [Methylobacteriaceae bacterium]
MTRFFSLLTFYCVIGGLVYFFVDQAYSGNRGVEAKNTVSAEVQELRDELARLKTERDTLEHRISLLRDDRIDRDLLEERARIVLGRVHANDVVIMLDAPDSSKQ